MRIELSDDIEPDLEAIADWIATGNPTRAVSFVRELRQEILRIARNPYLYRLRHELRPAIRIASYGSYVILFWVREETVRIERVVHGSRDLPRILQ